MKVMSKTQTNLHIKLVFFLSSFLPFFFLFFFFFFLFTSAAISDVSGERPAITWRTLQISPKSGLSEGFGFQHDLIRSAILCGQLAGIWGRSPLHTCSGIENIVRFSNGLLRVIICHNTIAKL